MGAVLPLAGVLALASCSSGAAPEPAASTSAAPSAGSAPSQNSVTVTPSPSRPPSASAVPLASSPISACVRQHLEQLSLSERAGQLLMIGVPASRAQNGATVVARYRVGGIFLSGRSSASLTTIKGRTGALNRAAGNGPGLLIATDQEGGAVQVLGGRGFTAIPAALTQGSWSQGTLRARTLRWARALAGAGISMDLAPVADTVTAARAPGNPPIGRYRREYGHTTKDVVSAVTTVVQSLAAARVVATVKHFPGLGRVRFNTDTSAGASDSVTTADDIYLRPFVAGIQAGAGAVMVSSARYPKLDAKHIAAFSQPIITGLLRERLGYRGVVISDDLGRARAVSGVPAAQRAVRFLRAGGDIVLSVRTADARTMRNALVAEARASATFKATLDAAVVRVLQLKERAGLLGCS